MYDSKPDFFPCTSEVYATLSRAEAFFCHVLVMKYYCLMEVASHSYAMQLRCQVSRAVSELFTNKV